MCISKESLPEEEAQGFTGTHTVPPQSCQTSGEAGRVNWSLWDAQILLHLTTINGFVVWWMQSKQGPAGAVLSPDLKIRHDEQNKCTKLHICPMNVEAFVKEGEVLHWCDASSEFSQHDDPVWPKLLTQFTCRFAGLLQQILNIRFFPLAFCTY